MKEGYYVPVRLKFRATSSEVKEGIWRRRVSKWREGMGEAISVRESVLVVDAHRVQITSLEPLEIAQSYALFLGGLPYLSVGLPKIYISLNLACFFFCFRLNI